MIYSFIIMIPTTVETTIDLIIFEKHNIIIRTLYKLKSYLIINLKKKN